MTVETVEKTAEEYRQRANEMKQQARRAETVYLQAIYSSIADNWDRLAEQMRSAERAQNRATENWEKLAQAHEAEDHPVPPPQADDRPRPPRH